MTSRMRSIVLARGCQQRRGAWLVSMPATWLTYRAIAQRSYRACTCSAGAAGSSSASSTEGGEPVLVRLNKRLSELGLCSRRESDGYIQRGLVEVDGKVVSVLGSKVTRQQRVALTPTAEAHQRSKLTVILNKPRGFISSSPNTPRQRPASRLLTLVNYDRQRGKDQPLLWPFPVHERGTRRKQRRQLPRGWARGLAPAGRLDMDSTGMLILTQDGTLARALIGGDGKVEKEYHVTVTQQQMPPNYVQGGAEDATVVTKKQLALLRYGLHLDGRQLRPALVDVIPEVIVPYNHQGNTSQYVRRKPKRGRNRDRQYSKLRSSRNPQSRRHFSQLSPERKHGTRSDPYDDASVAHPTAELRIVLREGRYRQIRRMCDAVGLNVHGLHRVRIGDLAIGDLSTGYWRFATESDIAQLTHSGSAGDTCRDGTRSMSVK